ncbi:MAG: adenylate/guanylate cyclase domain-containing protein [Deltaproteobacteria bacterium]|nr:MAG: adenylate/guanylate cyclase domain-containing protein [Deltaproteobacteria bacterium]
MEQRRAYLRAVEKERERAGRQILWLRILGLSLWNLVNAWYLYATPAESTWTAAPLLAVYLAVGVGMWGASRIPEVRRRLWLAMPLLDMPALFGIMWLIMPMSPAPQSLAGTALGMFFMLGAVVQLALDTRLLAMTGAVSAVLLPMLWWRAGLPSAAPGAFALVVAYFIGLHYLPRRLEVLLGSIVRERTQRERMGRYFSPAVAEVIAKQSAEERKAAYREITVLFADLRGFTAMSERMTPGEVAALLNEVHSAMVDVLFANGATLDKFMGDGIMAYFSAPIAQEDHAERAVRCALQMQKALAELNASRTERMLPTLDMGIGLHTGPAIVGDLGPAQRREYTAIGDTVNVASRMESMTKTVGVSILVTGEVVELAGHRFAFEAKGAFEVKGKTSRIETFTPTGESA